jgi:DNA polymerase IV (DinB-like DNA polymerase)
LLQRVIVHIDLDYFYAQCEENSNPSLRGKPVVVCVYSGRTEDSGVISTCNYEARGYGVRAGIPIVRAKKLLEGLNAAYLPMNRPHYEEVSNRIMDIPRAYADSFEKAGIDEAYLDLSVRTRGDFVQAKDIAAEMKQQIFQQEHVTCSVGIAPNKLIAKIASDHQKPNGLTLVMPEGVKSFLANLPVETVPGVGKKAGERLQELNVKTIDDLSRIEPTTLVERFGKSVGGYLFQAAQGQDDEPVKEREQPTQFSRIGTLKQNSRKIDEISPVLEGLMKSVSQKLVENHMACKSVSIMAILDDLSIHSKSATFDSPTFDESILRRRSKQLLQDFLDAMPDAQLRRVGVRASGLSMQAGQTDISKFLEQ